MLWADRGVVRPQQFQPEQQDFSAPKGKVRFGEEHSGSTSPTPIAPASLRITPPNAARELQMRRQGGLEPLGASHHPLPSSFVDP